MVIDPNSRVVLVKSPLKLDNYNQLTFNNVVDQYNYFSNIFRQQTGMKLWDYVSEKRVALAAKLLIENPNDSVITIALKCGYNNCPNFNRSFKKYTGMTPMSYRKMYRSAGIWNRGTYAKY